MEGTQHGPVCHTPAPAGGVFGIVPTLHPLGPLKDGSGAAYECRDFPLHGPELCGPTETKGLLTEMQ